MTIKGYYITSVPDPAHENCTPNWWKIEKRFNLSFDGATEEECFKKIQKYDDHAYYSTCNGVVPFFQFDDEERRTRYRAYCKMHQ